MAAITVLVVVLRRLFEVGSIPLQESVMYMHGLVLLLGIPYTLQADGHVRVDIFYSRMNAQQQRWVNLIGHCLFLLPVVGYIFFYSLAYVSASWAVLEGSSEVGGLPAIFLLKTLIPLTALMLFLQGLAEIGKLIIGIKP